jgi:hypothetical protein
MRSRSDERGQEFTTETELTKRMGQRAALLASPQTQGAHRQRHREGNPEGRSLAAAWRAAKARAEIARAVDKANERAKRWRKARAPEGLAEQVRALLDKHPAMAWDAALRRIVDAKP